MKHVFYERVFNHLKCPPSYPTNTAQRPRSLTKEQIFKVDLAFTDQHSLVLSKNYIETVKSFIGNHGQTSSNKFRTDRFIPHIIFNDGHRKLEDIHYIRINNIAVLLLIAIKATLCF